MIKIIKHIREREREREVPTFASIVKGYTTNIYKEFKDDETV